MLRAIARFFREWWIALGLARQEPRDGEGDPKRGEHDMWRGVEGRIDRDFHNRRKWW